MTNDNLPLAGTTVVAVEQAVAVPFATRQFADLGADVVKIERPDGGDFARSYDSTIHGKLATHFAWLNRGKRSVALDLRTTEGHRALDALLTGADVFIHNLAPGAMSRLGYSADVLSAQFPRLINAELTGYGEAGPMRDYKAYDLLIQAETGVISITGSPDTPAKTGIPIADISAGSFLVQAVMAALLGRARTGQGDHIRVSLFDCLVEWMGYPIYKQLYGGAPPARVGLAHPTVVPYDAYPTADGDSVLIGVQNNRGWRALASDVLGLPELVDDHRCATNEARCANRAFVDETVASATSRLTTSELTGRLVKAGIPTGRVNTVREVIDHPQLAERQRWTVVDSPAGRIAAVLPPIISDRFAPVMGPVPALGEHTAEVLAEVGVDTLESAPLREEHLK